MRDRVAKLTSAASELATVDEAPKGKRRKRGDEMASAARRVAPTPLRKENWYPLVASYMRDLAATNKTPKTCKNYREGLDDFARWMRQKGHGLNVADITREQVADYVADHFAARQLAASTAHLHLRCVRKFCQWLVDEGELDRNPCARIANPIVPVEAPPVFSEAELKRLLATCEKGRDFFSRRDYAILRVLLSCGMRRAEIANLHVAHIDMDAATLTIYGKARRHRTLTFGQKAGMALDRYLRERARYQCGRYADEPRLWIGERGPLTPYGLYFMVRRRAQAAGLGNRYPHLFRHTAAHMWLASNGSEGGVMKRMGWNSRAMLQRYGSSMAEERAREEYRRLTPDDRI